jgi:hypothetical protein
MTIDARGTTGVHSIPEPPSGAVDEPVASRPRWPSLAPAPLTRETLGQLLRNEIPLVMLPAIATPEECARLVEASSRIGFEPYEHVDPPIDRIGITVFEYVHVGMAAYFADAGRARAAQREIFTASFDPLERVIARMSGGAGVSVDVAVDPTLGRYHAGLVRRIEQGTMLHIDFAPAEQPDWHVSAITAQLAWNFYVELDGDRAGRTRVYNRPWVPRDELLKIPDTYGYRHELVRGAQRLTFQPTLGDVYLFNTRNFHEVEPSTGRRTTCTSQMGLQHENHLVLWS